MGHDLVMMQFSAIPMVFRALEMRIYSLLWSAIAWLLGIGSIQRSVVLVIEERVLTIAHGSPR